MTQWSSLTGGTSLALLPQQPPALAVPRALFFGLALVVELLAAREGKLDLGAAPFVEIELERDERHALALDRTDELVDLPAVQQELARPLRRMIEAVCLLVFGNVRVDQPYLAATAVRVGFTDRRLAETQRFHLRTGESDAGFECFVDEVIETGLAVVGEDAELPFSLRHAAVLRLPGFQRVADFGQQLHFLRRRRRGRRGFRLLQPIDPFDAQEQHEGDNHKVDENGKETSTSKYGTLIFRLDQRRR